MPGLPELGKGALPPAIVETPRPLRATHAQGKFLMAWGSLLWPLPNNGTLLLLQAQTSSWVPSPVAFGPQPMAHWSLAPQAVSTQ